MGGLYFFVWEYFKKCVFSQPQKKHGNVTFQKPYQTFMRKKKRLLPQKKQFYSQRRGGSSFQKKKIANSGGLRMISVSDLAWVKGRN